MKGGRRLARELAFQTLFELEVRPGRSLEEAFQKRRAAVGEEQGRKPALKDLKFAESLVRETLAKRGLIDERIHNAAPAFPLDQMPATDRVALELGTCELLYLPAVPLKVAINEAVDLAKTYGGENSGRFVNGVLGTIAEDVPEQVHDSGARRQPASSE